MAHGLPCQSTGIDQDLEGIGLHHCVKNSVLTCLKSSESPVAPTSFFFMYLSDACAGRHLHFGSYGIRAHGGRGYACMRYDISMFTCAAHGRNALRAPYAPTSTEPAAGCKWGGRKDWGRGIAHSSNGSPRLQVGHHRDHRQEAGAGPHRAQTRSRHLSPKALPYGKSNAPEAP